MNYEINKHLKYDAITFAAKAIYVQEENYTQSLKLHRITIVIHWPVFHLTDNNNKVKLGD